MRYVRFTAIVLVSILGAIAAGIVIVPLMLPSTRCLIERAVYEDLAMNMRYAEVAGRLGCDGHLTVSRNLGAVSHEIYAWRGKVWPYGEAHLDFYDGTLQKKTLIWLNLALSKR